MSAAVFPSTASGPPADFLRPVGAHAVESVDRAVSKNCRCAPNKDHFYLRPQNVMRGLVCSNDQCIYRLPSNLDLMARMYLSPCIVVQRSTAKRHQFCTSSSYESPTAYPPINCSPRLRPRVCASVKCRTSSNTCKLLAMGRGKGRAGALVFGGYLSRGSCEQTRGEKSSTSPIPLTP